MIGGRGLALGAFLGWASLAPAAATPSFTDIQAAYTPSEALLLDRHGKPLSELRVDTKIRRLDWVSLVDVSPAMTETLIAAEDRRFYEHAGVDWAGLAGAAWDSLWRQRPGGAHAEENGAAANHGSTYQSAFGSSPNISGAYSASTRVVGR